MTGLDLQVGEALGQVLVTRMGERLTWTAEGWLWSSHDAVPVDTQPERTPGKCVTCRARIFHSGLRCARCRIRACAP